jgi:predicted nuclease of predicted toxin-antitoxin system
VTGAARRILLDENMPRSLAEALVAAGHDVLSVATVAAGIDDRAVLDLARSGNRWLLTFDSDFGELVFQKGEAPPPAILFFRLHPMVQADLLALALRALADDAVAGFTVVTREGTRRRPFTTVAPNGGP